MVIIVSDIKYLKKIKYTEKLGDQILQEAFEKELEEIKECKQENGEKFNKIIYLDEMGVDKNTRIKYGRSKKGTEIYGEKLVNDKKEKRINIVAALWDSKLIAPAFYTQNMDYMLFEKWFEFDLLQQIETGFYIIMDNASFHKKQNLINMAEQYGCKILFLPPYSPKLNPIENYWAIKKGEIKKMRENGHTILYSICNTFPNLLSLC